jgi:hypothetical protein
MEAMIMQIGRRLERIAMVLVVLIAGAIPAAAMGYEDLLRAALDRDPGLRLLAIKAERAELAAERLARKDGTPVLALETGALQASLSSGSLAVSGSPSLSLAFPHGPDLSLGLPFSAAASASSFAPTFGFRYPLARQGDPRLAELATARAASAEARAALDRRRLEVEKALAEALREAAEASAALESTKRELEKAKSALERARLLDGLEPGSAAALSLERAVRVQERKERDGEAALERALQKAAALCGLELPPGGGAWDFLMPPELPAATLDAALPEPGSLATVRRAAESLRITRIAAAEAARGCGLDLELAAAWSRDDYAALSTSASDTASASGGLGLTLPGLSLSLGLGYKADLLAGTAGPMAVLKASWKPADRADLALEAKDWLLSVAEAEEDGKAALEEAGASLLALERRRADLLAAAEDLAEDLSFATEQSRLYASWRERGAVSDADYAEVLAFEAEARARVLGAAFDALIWNLDLGLLGAAPQDGAASAEHGDSGAARDAGRASAPSGGK